ncbi:prepilin-type N-terminal cleavage/methylation domain-containing protein, partial [Gammaproteobacteria bacterium]|nr:prepilin-type N-terminal cleavage/methylation domain-containing protein [Gammaproteobacteria bacterium]
MSCSALGNWVKPKQGQGFTLIEMVVAILIMSIISIGLVRFILDSTDGYIRTATRNQLSSSGRAVIDRISMEVHNALPNSIRIGSADAAGNQCLEFVPVRAASSYINPPFGSASTTFNAEAVIDEGLLLAPNHSEYKKIKARLFMREGENLQALHLLENVPPVLADDVEYFELMASLNQQTNNHVN